MDNEFDLKILNSIVNKLFNPNIFDPNTILIDDKN